MDLLELMKNRYSVRSFAALPVEEEKIAKITEAGRIAPTARNNQPCLIRVIRSKEGLAKLSKCTVCNYGETLAFIITYKKDECWKREYDGALSGEVDSAIITAHMMLEAEALGIGTCWVMYFMPDAVREEFELPENEEPVAILLAGYPSEKAAPSPRHSDRKRAEEIATEI